MSLFGAMNTAISGIGAQAAAFGNISDNVANSQTVGFKRVDTAFEDYLTTSTAAINSPGAVVAIPQYVNNEQGAISQTSNPLNMAIAGQGFFAVSQQTGEISGQPTFNPQQFYTRTGDFQMNKDGYLVNSAGQFLNGWPVDQTTGIANQNSLSPVQVSQSAYNPIATSQVTLSANLPATPASQTATLAVPISSDINVYDALGTIHTVSLNWVQNADNNWTVSVVAPDALDDTVVPQTVPPTYNPNLGAADVQFGATSGNPVPAGTVGQIAPVQQLDNNGNPIANAGAITTAGYVAGTPATLSFTSDFGSGPQTITLNLGTYGKSGGVTQYAGSSYQLQGLTQNGVAPGSFSGVIAQENGDIVVNYDNGQTRTLAQVPVVTFNAPDSLQAQNGQAFSETLSSGTPLAEPASINGAGNLVVSSVEGSNVDIAAEFSQLIVAQSAYSANTKVITTAAQMLQQTVNMQT
jgi:flagellar hook protein FlgE